MNDPQPASPRNHYAGPIRRYRATVAYDGSAFHGWQKQHPPDSEPLRTVQGVLESAMTRLFNQPVRVTGASRTDSGVHAIGQVMSFDVASPIPESRMRQAINGRLPDDVELRTLVQAADDFEVIADVVSKQYRYTLHNASTKPLAQRHVMHHCIYTLDVDRMNDAARRLLGTHDIEGFAAAGHGRESTVRTIHHCRVLRHAHEPTRVEIEISSNGFLLNTVRIIAGTLVEIGRGQFTPQRVDEILETADRQLAGPTLPPNGLCLEWVRYREDEPLP